MSKWFAVPTALIVLAMTAPVSADWFAPARQVSHQANSVLASTVGGPVIMHGGSYGMAPAGYPFYSGCCEAKSSCCSGLWAGFCARPRIRHHRHRGCGCGVSSCGGCASGKGAVQSCGKGAVQSYGKGAVQSYGKGAVQSYGKGGGCGGCSTPRCGCGGHRFGLGLFDWLHAGRGCGRGHGCSTCGVAIQSSCGCSSGHSSKYAPATKHAVPMYQGTIIPDVTPAVPAPEPVSIQSAARRSPLRFRIN